MLAKTVLLLLISLLARLPLQAQLCKGSLGDPIINITFGAGAGNGGPLASTKNLQYLSFDCPNDGFYTVTNKTSHCFGETWHALNADHTGDANGYFMLINASLQKSEFYIDTVRGLCPNTTYEFAAWVMNVIQTFACSGNPINPNLTFNIETTSGTILNTYSTGDIFASSNPNWKQYGFFFTTPLQASDVVLRIINNSTGGCGNDLAIDDITFRPCGPEINSYIVGEPGAVKELCVGNSASVTLSSKVSEGFNNPSYQWQEKSLSSATFRDIPGATSTTYARQIPANTPVGNYSFRLTVAEGTNSSIASCRIASNSLAINLNDKPVPNIQSNTPICEGSPINLSASGGATYLWTGQNSFSDSGASVTINNAEINNSGTYYVAVVSAVGCKQEDSIKIEVVGGTTATTSFTSKTICEGDSLLLNASGGNSYLWYPTVGLSSSVVANPIAKPADSTVYTVVVQNDRSCKDSVTVTVNVRSAPKADAGSDINMLEGQPVQLAATASGGNTTYRWSPAVSISNLNILQPTVNPLSDITYFLTVTSVDGCGVASDSVNVHVFKKVIIPNAFSPNGDGINDTWNIKALTTYNNFELSVFSRYGQTVFSTKDYSKPWDGNLNGKALPVGTYYYVINLKQGLPILKGYVVILR